MSDPGFDQDPTIGLAQQNTLRKRFAGIAQNLGVQMFGGTFDDDGDNVMDSVEHIRAARFQFNEGSAVVSIAQTLGLGYRQTEHKVIHYGKPSKNAAGEYVRSAESYAIEKFELYDSDNPSDNPNKIAQPQHTYSQKVQRWVDSEAVGHSRWEDVSIDDGLRFTDKDGLEVYDFTFGPKEFASIMRIFDRVSCAKKIPLKDTPPTQ